MIEYAMEEKAQSLSAQEPTLNSIIDGSIRGFTSHKIKPLERRTTPEMFYLYSEAIEDELNLLSSSIVALIPGLLEQASVTPEDVDLEGVHYRETYSDWETYFKALAEAIVKAETYKQHPDIEREDNLRFDADERRYDKRRNPVNIRKIR